MPTIVIFLLSTNILLNVFFSLILGLVAYGVIKQRLKSKHTSTDKKVG